LFVHAVILSAAKDPEELESAETLAAFSHILQFVPTSH
jgi:hypothetical protein